MKKTLTTASLIEAVFERDPSPKKWAMLKAVVMATKGLDQLPPTASVLGILDTLIAGDVPSRELVSKNSAGKAGVGPQSLCYICAGISSACGFEEFDISPSVFIRGALVLLQEFDPALRVRSIMARFYDFDKLAKGQV